MGAIIYIVPTEAICRNTLNKKYGAPGRIRTSDRLVRSQVLYPTELRAHIPISLLSMISLSDVKIFYKYRKFGCNGPSYTTKKQNPLENIAKCTFYDDAHHAKFQRVFRHLKATPFLAQSKNRLPRQHHHRAICPPNHQSIVKLLIQGVWQRLAG